jgi:hypothetical protein
MLTRVIKAMLLAAALSFCFMNASVVHAQNQGGNGQGQNGNNQGTRPVAPEFDPRLFAGSVAILAGVLLLNGHRRKAD